jgi:hypothetical protein
MTNQALDAFARQTDLLLSRRRTVQGVALGILGALIAGFDGVLAKSSKKKRRRRRRGRRKKRQRNRASTSPPTCAEQCSEAFEVCLERIADSTLCGDTFSTACTPCFSDQDCVETPFPYCLDVNGIISRATEERSPILTDLCGPFFNAVCANVVI